MAGEGLWKLNNAENTGYGKTTSGGEIWINSTEINDFVHWTIGSWSAL